MIYILNVVEGKITVIRSESQVSLPNVLGVFSSIDESLEVIRKDFNGA